MLRSLRLYPLLFALALSIANVGLPTRAQAQSYQIDCAILLCLSGGWPASVACLQARVEFIRRITPWPVEPPLQIWRCPMGASSQNSGTESDSSRSYDILFDEPNASAPENALWRNNGSAGALVPSERALRLVQNRADIDISGPEFNFVRSIRVFDVRSVYQDESGPAGDEECKRSASIYLGTYGTQGDFSWTRSSPAALPSAHVGLEQWGSNCPRIIHRSVFVEWRDYNGDYGFEQVNY